MPDTAALTGLTPQELASWLAEMRKATALSGEAALEKVDEVLWSYSEWQRHRTNLLSGAADDVPNSREDADYRAGLVREDLHRLAEQMARLTRTMAIPGAVPTWEAQSLRVRAEAIGYLAGPDARQALADEIRTAQAEAETLAAQLEVAVARQALTLAASKPIHNASSVAGIVASVDGALAELRRLDALTPEDEQQGRGAQMRASRYRADRKMEEADVVAAGGNLKKAERLRAEAGTLLRIDLAKANLTEEGL